jgi:acyl carrier protein
MPPSSPSPEQVLDEVTEMIREVVGDDFLPSEITMETSFSEDLELESIEFVALAEKMQARYGKEVDFTGWLSGMELDRILGLRAKDLVDFIVRSTS